MEPMRAVDPPAPTPNEPEWCASLRAARAGDAAAYGRLVELFWADLLRVARGIAPLADAEDVVQEALVHAWRRLGTLRDAAALPAWLRRAVVRRGLRRRRWALRARPLELVARRLATPSEPRDLKLDAVRLFARLPDRQRASLFLTEVEGLTDAEAAHDLGLGISTLRVHRHRARANLRRWLAEDSR